MTFLLAIKHLHGLVDVLYCHFTNIKKKCFMHIMQHYHALDIHVLTVTESAVVEAPS